MYFTIVGFILLLRMGLLVYFVLTEGQYLVPDSTEYIILAKNILEHQTFSLSSHPPFDIDFFRTPGYPFFLASAEYLGVGSPYWVVFWQELIYCLSLWLFYRYSLPLFGKTITRTSLLFLLIEPGGLAYPKIFFSETLFLPFFILGLLFVGHYLQKFNWRYLVLSGIIMGIGTIIRPALQYFPIIIAFTIILFNFRRQQCWLHSGLLLFTVALTISPWLIHNHHHSGKLFLSGQQSNMFANYHVPRVWMSARSIPFSKGQQMMKNKVNTAIDQKEKRQGRPLIKIEKYAVQKSIAFNELKQYPYEYTKQWLSGALRAMVGLHLPTLKTALNVPKTTPYLHDIKAHTFILQVWEFLKTQPIHVFALLIIRGVIALFALLGALAIVKSKNCFLWIMMLVNFYFIFMAGPMADSRFRYPIESFWFVQAYYGFIWVFSYLKKDHQVETSNAHIIHN